MTFSSRNDTHPHHTSQLHNRYDGAGNKALSEDRSLSPSIEDQQRQPRIKRISHLLRDIENQRTLIWQSAEIFVELGYHDGGVGMCCSVG
jgi:hypothetical protein